MCMPRYLVHVVVGISILFILRDGHCSFFRGKFTCADLVSFISIFHFCVQVCIRFRWVCKVFEATTGLTFVVRITVSSAIVPVTVFSLVGRSDV
jgi:hypothetical protein